MWHRTSSLGLFLAAALSLACVAGHSEQFPSRSDPSDRIGVKAPPLRLRHWLNSPPLEIDQLRGKVVLVRWWTDTCPFCAASAPPLVEFHDKYGDQGLVVIAVFHPKPAGDWSIERVQGVSKRFGFPFPVALDADWTALRRWWLDEQPRGWTSVSFLVDKQGVIRYVHPGGEYHPGSGGQHWSDHESCNREYRQIDETIARLLAE